MIQFSREKVLLLHKLITEETGGVFSRQRLMMVSGTQSLTNHLHEDLLSFGFCFAASANRRRVSRLNIVFLQPRC